MRATQKYHQRAMTIFPEPESGIRLGKRISSRSLLNYVQLGSDFSLQEAVPSSWNAASLQ